MKPMLEYRVGARRIVSHGSVASTKDAEIVLDTEVNDRPDAFNPAELLLAAIAACMIKGIERVTPMIKFDLRGLEVKLHGIRQGSPRKMVRSTMNSSLIPTKPISAMSANTARSRTVWL
jgi:uncharacterized OsmC-like protein